MANSNKEIISALHDFYSATIRLPYIDADALILPPSDGWSDVNADELRKRGKTEGVIELLRHLPYLRNPGGRRKWMLSPDTLAIDYGSGEMYDLFMDELQSIPAHCIWLTAHDSRDGIDLILDTITGSITVWSMLGRSVMVEPAEYEQLDKADQWMCYPTLPAVDLLKFWQARWEKLVWIPVYNPKGSLATASWWRRAIPCSDEEEYILNSDTEYDPMDDGSDVESGSSDSGAESEGGEDNTSAHVDEGTSKKVLSDKEVTELLADAFGEGGQKFRISTPPEDWKEEGGEDWEEGEEGEDEDWEEEGGEDWEEGGGEAKGNEERTDKPILASGVKSDAQAFAKPNQEEEAQALYAIFQRHGWPDHFDREKCRAELNKFQQSRQRS
ncbi:hypothetical protein F4825DRAFT_276611 [Nemania diffusa]|nr:hypothetical protein F4825DRAFT_276611 [Nemania diffusa]